MSYRVWCNLWFDTAELAIDASAVVTLRIHKLAALDQAAFSEAGLMVAEKVAAAADIGFRAWTGQLGHTPEHQARATVSRLHHTVAGNRRRLQSGR